MASASEVARCRLGMANLLSNLVKETGEIERRLDIEVDEGEGVSKPEAWQREIQKDPSSTFRLVCVQLLRKARIHALAALRANETLNVHSLAVQMRPALECAGQVVHIFHYLMIAPDFQMERERALGLLTDYLDADYYDTLMRYLKDNEIHKKLLQTISEAAAMAAMEFGMPEPKARKGKRLRQENKVEMLPGGKAWYDHLSMYFCHGEANWTGPSWQGGVGPMDITHQFACAGLMQQLVEQMARMNAYASLCPIDDTPVGSRADAALTKLREVMEAASAFRRTVRSASTHTQASEV
ncbi:MAG: hypothetical protein OXO50_21055 [Caldilineaceae bacterium]|nr:hypothetical protein [Caldilineaceae bacterium]